MKEGQSIRLVVDLSDGTSLETDVLVMVADAPSSADQVSPTKGIP